MAFVALLAGCDDDWYDNHSMFPIVWADDDSEVALVVHSWEQRGLFTDQEYRGWRYQLFLESTNGGFRRPISSQIPATGFSQVSSLFYMKSLGYVLLGSVRGDTTFVEQFQLPSGGRREVDRAVVALPDCGTSPRKALPSPSGAHIALYDVFSPCSGVGAGNGRFVIRMLDAITLDTRRVDTVAAGVGSSWRVRWTPAGDLVAVYGTQAWSLAPTRAPIAIAMPTCFGAPTTSTWISSTGVRLVADGLKVVKDASNPELPLPAFGCP